MFKASGTDVTVVVTATVVATGDGVTVTRPLKPHLPNRAIRVIANVNYIDFTL